MLKFYPHTNQERITTMKKKQKPAMARGFVDQNEVILDEIKDAIDRLAEIKGDDVRATAALELHDYIELVLR